MLLRYLVWLAVPLLALLELVAHAYHSTRVPAPEQWQHSLPSVVRELRHEGDLIVAAPAWSEPNLRFALGDQLMPLRDIARADERGYSRAIEVSVGGAVSPALANWKTIEERKLGHFKVRVLQNPAPRVVLFDFVDHLDSEHAAASIRAGSERKDCRWTDSANVSNGALDFGHPTFPQQRFRCPSSEWNFVGVTVIEDQEYRPRRCIWAPPSNSKATQVTFDDVPLGSVVRGYAALPYWNERWGKKNGIQIQLSVDGNVVGQAEHNDGEGWKGFEFSTAEFAGKRGSVQFEITPTKGASHEFCFHAEADQ